MDGKGLPPVAKAVEWSAWRRPTIYDVAPAAGVATSTVSRAFSHPEPGQRRDPGARAGRGRPARLPAEPARPRAALRPPPHGGDGGLRHHQPALLRADPRRRACARRPPSTRWSWSTPRSRRGSSTTRSSGWCPAVDGFVLAASRLPDENLQQVAGQRPVVLMNREVAGLASVVLDHVQGCRQIVEHLASLGHRHLVYLAGPRNSWMAATRWAALGRAADRPRRRGPADRAVHPEGLPGRRRRRRRAQLRGDRDRSPTTTCWRSASSSASRSGRCEVPEDVSVVGFDDIFAAELCTPGLTTLGGAHADVGRAAVEILLDAVGPDPDGVRTAAGDAADRAGAAGHHRARAAVTRGHPESDRSPARRRGAR